jgi:cell division transport system permease protein
VKFDYVLRETFANLRRNFTLTFAAIVTIAVCLSLFGSTLLMRQGVDNVAVRWREGIEVIAFLKSDVSDEQHDAITAFLDESPEVGDWSYVDIEESREEALRVLEGHPAMQAKIEDGARVPDSYRLKPSSSDINLMDSLGTQLEELPGVLQVNDVSEAVKTVKGVSTFMQRAMFIGGTILLVASLLLILNHIRMATFARRREIEVMKRVGATNWFIRVPFMLEGIVQGIVGAVVAIGAVVGVDRFMQAASANEDYRAILDGFVATPSDLMMTAVVIVVLGIVIGAAGSSVALSRFLKV